MLHVYIYACIYILGKVTKFRIVGFHGADLSTSRKNLGQASNFTQVSYELESDYAVPV